MLRRAAVIAVAAGTSVWAARPVLADPAPQCHVVDIDFIPSDSLQIVAWVEKPDGTFVDTVFLTNKVGRYGIGNRPGRFDLNSGPIVNDMWPYGRRITTFPVWAHRHGLSWPQIDFQDGQDNDISHESSQSTPEVLPFCRPMNPVDPGDSPSWDAGTCASPANVFSDKGVFSATVMSLYPPRADIDPKCTVDGCDSPSVGMYKMMNPFDAITQATPTGGTQAEITWPIPPEFPAGNYVMFVEAAKAFDFNGTYNQTTYPSPAGIPYGAYGVAYRGQPSVVYAVPFTIGTTTTVASTAAYVGYSDPDGSTGTLHPPDATIETSMPGSGASRLMILMDGTNRVTVTAKPEFDHIPPAIPGQLATTTVSSSSASLSFVAPGSDGNTGKATGYDIRYLANTELTADNFATATAIAATVVPTPAGTTQTVDLAGLLPETDYWVGVRAYDDCRNLSDLAIVHFTTSVPQPGYVDACFVATAAYGSLMANDVEPLRHFRDTVLRHTVLGELAIETYYTFGPPVAGVVGESELLRASARAVLAPVIARIRASGR